MIDRFFDAMDLNNTDIYIEWETPKSKNSGGIKSVSETYLKMIDDENYPGKLIFGWAISDAITKDSGTLKFAVRFVQWNDEKKIVYSFNTLTAQATIHPNLGLDLENDSYDVDNCNDRLLERIEPSVVVGGAQAAVPYFLQDVVMLDEGYDIVPNHTDGTYSLSVVATADDTGAVSYVWKRSEIGKDAWVEVPGSTTVDFVELTRKEYEDFEWRLPENRIYHIERSDETAYLLPKGYYDLNDAATRAWFKTNHNVDIGAGEIPHLFEKRSVLTVEKYGQYKAEARNRIFNSLTKKDSNYATFKEPDPVVMDNKNQSVDKHIIGTESATLAPVVVEAIGDLSYQWYKADEMNVLSQKVAFTGMPEGSLVSYGEETACIMCPKDAEYNLQNSGPGSDKNSYYIGMNLFAPEGAVSFREGECGLNPADTMPELEPAVNLADAPHGVDSLGRTYRARWIPVAVFDPNTGLWRYYAKGKGVGEFVGWKYEIVWLDANGVEIERNFMKIKLANEINFEELNDYKPIIGEGATDPAYIASEPGLYRLEVVRTRNRGTTKPEDGRSIEYRVTNAPAIPVFVEGTYDAMQIITVDDLLAGIKTLNVEWENDIKSDEFYVSWYLYRGDKKMDDLEIVTYKISGAFSSVFNPADSFYAPIFEAAGEDVEGFYYAIVKNKLNGIESAYNEKPERDKMFNVTGS